MDSNLNEKELLKKFLYSDNIEGGAGTYLNINLLRKLKNLIVSNMTDKERGCINLYHLENYLIERALDSATEELYQGNYFYKIDSENLIEDILKYLRTKPDYWIINSEVYLDIMANNFSLYYDDKYENKDLTAIYNFIYQQKQKDISINKEKDFDVEVSVEESAFKRYFKLDNKGETHGPDHINKINFEILKDPNYPKFIKFLENDLFYEINETNKTIFDTSITHHIYNYFFTKNRDLLSDKIKQMNLQNLILFFSHVEYDCFLEYLWNSKNHAKTKNSHSHVSKKYSLRLSRVNEEEMEKSYISDQIKIFQINESIANLKQCKEIGDFINYLQKNSSSSYICKEESTKNKDETKFKIILNSYNILVNILRICGKYLEKNYSLQIISEGDLNVNTEGIKILFEIYSNMKNLYRQIVSDDEIVKYLEFYLYFTEGRNNYLGCLKILENVQKNYKKEDNNLFSESEKNINTVCRSYINDYFDSEASKIKRKYKYENAGFNWTEEDLQRFNEGMRLYGHCQLANIKIAKFMGDHIEASHVKLFRGKIIKEKRQELKNLKEARISEMKRNRSLKWKPMSENLL